MYVKMKQRRYKDVYIKILHILMGLCGRGGFDDPVPRTKYLRHTYLPTSRMGFGPHGTRTLGPSDYFCTS